MSLRRTLIGTSTVCALVVSLFGLAAQPAGAAFSGANGRVVFVSNRTGTNQVFSMNPDGTGVVQLTSVGTNFDPNVSVDGAQIVFVSTRDGSNEVYVMPSYGGTQTRMTTSTLIESHPVWAPNGWMSGSFHGSIASTCPFQRLASLR